MRRPAIRTGWVVIALLAAGCSTAAPSGPATTVAAATPTALPTSSATPVVTTAPGPSSAVPSVRAMLFDTDVAGDDLVALAFLVASPSVDLVGMELFTANPFMVDGSFYHWDSLAAQLAAGYPVGSFEPACIVVEEAEGPESGFTRPGCDTPNIQYLATVDASAAENTLLGVLNGS